MTVKKRTTKTTKKKTSARSTKKTMLFNVSAMRRLIQHVHLGGTIDDIVLIIEDGIATIDAFDISQSLFVHAVENVGQAENCKIGLQQIGIFLKVLEAIKEDTVQYVIGGKDNQWLELKIKGRGDARFLLTDPDLIPTFVDSKEPIRNMTNAVKYELSLAQKPVEDFLYFMKFFASEAVVISIIKGQIVITPSQDSPQSFDVEFGKLKDKIDLEATVIGKHFEQVIGSIIWQNEVDKDEIVQASIMRLGQKPAPLIITQGKNRFWAITAN